MLVTTLLLLSVISALLVGFLLEARQLRISLNQLFLVTNSVLSGIREGVSEMSGGIDELRIRDLEDAIHRLPRKWEDVKREANAADARARHHVKRIRSELEERGLSDPGADAMAEQLGILDGNGSEAEGLQPVPESLESVQASAAAVTSEWEDTALAKKYGRQ